MAKIDSDALQASITKFRATYEARLDLLVELLNSAHISHYASGCGTKRVTFEIFPASDQIRELQRMISLDRDHKSGGSNGMKDAIAKTEQNPGVDFLLYLRRWTGFCEQAMKTEGASARGVAAAKAKLLMEELFEQLGESKQGTPKHSEFTKLMREIGLTLENRTIEHETLKKAQQKKVGEKNYKSALTIALGAISAITTAQAS